MTFILMLSSCTPVQEGNGHETDTTHTPLQTDTENSAGTNDNETLPQVLKFDLSKIDGDGQQVLFMCPAGDRVLFFTGDKNASEYPPSDTRIYAYDLNKNDLSEGHADVGCINGRQTILHDDGSVSFIETDDDTFRKDRITFLDPKNLEVTETFKIPEEYEIWDITISADKKRVAFNDEDGMYVTDPTFSDVKKIKSRQNGQNDDDIEMPAPITFYKDGNRLLYTVYGWEFTYGAGEFNIETGEDQFFEVLADKELILTEDGLLFAMNAYDIFPAGFFDPEKPYEGTHITLPSLDITGDDTQSAMTAMLSDNGKYLGVLTQDLKTEGRGKSIAVKILDAHTGKLLDEFAQKLPEESTTYFEEILFSPDSRRAVFSIIYASDGRKEIFSWEFNKQNAF